MNDSDWKRSIWHSINIASCSLAPAGFLYGLGWRIYRTVYDLGFKHPQRAHPCVVCVGSLLSGGAGKSPVTRHVADVLADMGRRPVVSISGYRSQRREGATLAPEGPLEARVWGDETAEFRLLRPGVPLIAGRDRVMAAKIAAAEFPGSVLLMDDGFQHLPLAKDATIVLDPPHLSNRMPLPAGAYREPWHSGLRRAGLVIPHEGMAAVLKAFSATDEQGSPVAWPDTAQPVCGIAGPERMLYMLEEQGVRLGRGALKDDHDPLDSPGLFDQLDPALPIICAAKDWVKLRDRPDRSRWRFIIVRLELEIAPAEQFRDWLASRLPF